MYAEILLPKEKLEDFCQKWRIVGLSLFSSALRENFAPESDLDVLVSFESGAELDLFDMIDMREEIESIVGRDVDLVEKEGLRNPFRRHEILKTREVLYVA